jgi:hypothetical protein
LPLILLAIIVFLTIITAPSGFYARAKVAEPSSANTTTSASGGVMAKLVTAPADSSSSSNKQQYCDLFVPAITGKDGPEVQDQANISYR